MMRWLETNHRPRRCYGARYSRYGTGQSDPPAKPDKCKHGISLSLGMAVGIVIGAYGIVNHMNPVRR